MNKYKLRRSIAIATMILASIVFIILNPDSWTKLYLGPQSSASEDSSDQQISSNFNIQESLAQLERLAVKGRAPKTGYKRTEFYDNWPLQDGCNLRQRILKRDFGETAVLDSDNCTVISGTFYEPYKGEIRTFTEKKQISKGLQIDHIVALSDAWQKGAQQLSRRERFDLATDPLNLATVDSSANQQKSDGDAATWLPKNKSFRCQYVTRQISIKSKYSLWVTSAEKDAMKNVLNKCAK